MKTRIVLAIVLALGVCAASAHQTSVQGTPATRLASASKALQAAYQEKDPAKRAQALEAFIRDHPDATSLHSVAYQMLMTALQSVDSDRAAKLADDLIAKYPDPKSPIRRSAYTTKLSMMRLQRRTGALHALVETLLDSETDPRLLILAATYDEELGARLFEKALAERAKNTNPNAMPTADDLRWQYAQSLMSTPRRDEAIKMAQDVIESINRTIAEAEKLPVEDLMRRRAESMKRTLASRYQMLSRTMSNAGDYDKALEYLDLSIPKDPMSTFDSRPNIDLMRADIYAKMKKPDLQMESYARAYAARMDKTTADRIAELAKMTGIKPNKVYDRARKLRKESAAPIRPFQLKSIEGKPTTLSSVKGKVTLVNFFFPT